MCCPARRRSTWTTARPAVGTALARFEQPIVLVLDDLHLVANPACLDVLAELVRYVPAGSQIAVTSREAPALPLARWRSQGWVQEIGVADLRLDEQEAGLLLEAAGVELDAAQVSELTERTEGWPAGLYLAALSLQAGAAAARRRRALTGNDRFVSEYFRFELLSRLPPDEAQFLMYTSVLDRMCGGLCDAVLETTGSAETLARLGGTNGFVVPLDRTGEWYRYHHLFGQLLRDELERSEPELVSELNRRAMAWCVANDLARRRSTTGKRRARRTPSPAWSTPSARRSTTTAACETAGGVARVVRRRRARAVPRARRLRRLVACADGAGRGGRALARARRRRNLEDPALGRQRQRSSHGSPRCART